MGRDKRGDVEESGMIEAGLFIEAAREHGFRLYSGVPCSFLKPLINHVIDSDPAPGSGAPRYVGAANEGDAVAIAAGAELGGCRGVVMIQNSGLGNAVNPLTSLTHTFRIPVLLIVTLRGDPHGPGDEPQHELMGAITTRMLELMQIPWELFPTEVGQVEGTLDRAEAHMTTAGTPYALVMRQGSVAGRPLRSRPGPVPDAPAPAAPASSRRSEARATRNAMLRAIRAAARPTDVLLATTGYTGRELSALGDAENQLAMVGSMGCVSSLGLGLALAQPRRRVIAIDGDGALLMRLGVLTTIGHERPANLVHVVLDNQVHESTGGQATVSHAVELQAVAAACGYPSAARLETPEELEARLRDGGAGRGPWFIHAPIRPGTLDPLPRPGVAPPDVAQRLRAFLRETA
jgi:phosphonopyruvate decarboxylase